MNRKRSPDEEKEHLLRKIRKLEKKIYDLPESDTEDVNSQCPEVSKENIPPVDDEDQLLDGFISSEEEQDNLDDDILGILGIGPNAKPKKETLRKEIADRWTEILEKGLKKEEKEEINESNQPFDNCPKMVAPKLNKEVAAALKDSAKKRDTQIELRQKQISTSLSCLGHAMQLCIGEDIQDKKLDILKKINEATRVLCDVLYLDSKARRTLVLSIINKDLKDSLLETEPAEFLFGDNLTEKIKTAKAVQKSGKDLKTNFNDEKRKKRPETEKKKPLNWRGPPQSTQPRKQGGPAYHQQQQKKKYERKPPRR